MTRKNTRGKPAAVTELGLTLECGAKYAGETQDGLPHGTGTAVFANGYRYTGDWFRGKPHGQGEMMSMPMEAGNWRSKIICERVGYKLHGNVKVRFAHGGIYEGVWDRGRPVKKAQYFPRELRSYVGGFKNGLYDGAGELRYLNGDVYRGEFRRGKLSGRGVYHFIRGQVYSGEFRSGRIHGYGTLFWSNGWSEQQYEGQLEKGVAHGRGRFYDGGRLVYDGEWQNGQILGAGKYYPPNVEYVISGVWGAQPANFADLRFDRLDPDGELLAPRRSRPIHSDDEEASTVAGLKQEEQAEQPPTEGPEGRQDAEDMEEDRCEDDEPAVQCPYCDDDNCEHLFAYVDLSHDPHSGITGGVLYYLVDELETLLYYSKNRREDDSDDDENYYNRPRSKAANEILEHADRQPETASSEGYYQDASHWGTFGATGYYARDPLRAYKGVVEGVLRESKRVGRWHKDPYAVPVDPPVIGAASFKLALSGWTQALELLSRDSGLYGLVLAHLDAISDTPSHVEAAEVINLLHPSRSHEALISRLVKEKPSETAEEIRSRYPEIVPWLIEAAGEAMDYTRKCYCQPRRMAPAYWYSDGKEKYYALEALIKALKK